MLRQSFEAYNLYICSSFSSFLFLSIFEFNSSVFSSIFSFLRMRSPDIVWYQWYYPTILSLIVYFGWTFGGKRVIRFNSESIITDVNALVGILIGFYIAALAAVSSFTNKNLDQVMKGRAPFLISKRQGREVKENLTRRRFLSILFGYCTSISLFLYISGVIRKHIALENSVPENYLCIFTIVDEINAMFYLWLISSLLIVTLLGLHYLIERIHRD